MKLPAITIGLMAAGFGILYRALPEMLLDQRVIEKDRIAVVETYGIIPEVAAFGWSGGYAAITYPGEDIYIPLAVIVMPSSESTTLFMKGVCDNEVHIVCKGIGTRRVRCIEKDLSNPSSLKIMERADKAREELCNILDCKGICSEWKSKW